MPFRLVLTVVLGVVLLFGCSGEDVDGGADLARAACEYPAPSTPGFNPDTADLSLLVELDQVAAARSDLAAEAATLDERWQPLSDAATALAAFAGLFRQVRSDQGSVGDRMTSAMWDQVKLASDAFVIECRPVVGG